MILIVTDIETPASSFDGIEWHKCCVIMVLRNLIIVQSGGKLDAAREVLDGYEHIIFVQNLDLAEHLATCLKVYTIR